MERLVPGAQPAKSALKTAAKVRVEEYFLAIISLRSSLKYC